MPRRNRVDPWGDLVAHPARGLLTGNRGCVVDDDENVVRHHGSNLLWISCLLEFRGRRFPLARPRRWTPLFFLGDAVALAAGHRPCGECRREDYVAYRDGVASSTGSPVPPTATELNRRLAGERLRRGRGMGRARDRRLWSAVLHDLPAGTVVAVPSAGEPGTRGPAHLWSGGVLRPFAFDGWGRAVTAPEGVVDVLTPPTSVAALAHGYHPVLHPSATL